MWRGSSAATANTAVPAISRHWLAAIFVPAVVLLALIGLGAAAGYLNVRTVTSDVTMLGRASPLAGFLSYLGILLWWTAATACLFAAAVVGRRDGGDAFRFLLSAGLLSAYIAFDDLFRIHEAVAPRYAGIPEEAIYAALGFAVGLQLLVFRRLVRRTSYGLVLFSLVMLGASVAMDTLLHPWLRPLGQWEFFIEDGAKWLGIVSWSAYYTSASLQAVGAVGPALARPQAPPVAWTPGDVERRRAGARQRVGA